MKKNTALFIFLVIPFSLIAQATVPSQDSAEVSRHSSEDFVRQILLPREVYVGDTAELHYLFTSSADFFSEAGEQNTAAEKISIDTTTFSFVSAKEHCTITHAELKRSGTTYTLTVTFIPWEPGTITVAPFNLYAALRTAHSQEENLPTYMIDINPITIPSLAEKLGETSIRAPIGPLLIPGTKKILAILFTCVAMLIFVTAILLLKYAAVKNAWEQFLVKNQLVKNARRTKMKLRKLKTQQCPDTEFAQAIQTILREYLTFRFGCSFASVTTKHIQNVIQNATGNLYDPQKEESIFSLISLFTRTDYILFAKNSIDAMQYPKEEHEAVFSQGERERSIALAMAAIDTLEDKNQPEGAS